MNAQAALRADVEKLAAQVAALEKKVSAQAVISRMKTPMTTICRRPEFPRPRGRAPHDEDGRRKTWCVETGQWLIVGSDYGSLAKANPDVNKRFAPDPPMIAKCESDDDDAITMF